MRAKRANVCDKRALTHVRQGASMKNVHLCTKNMLVRTKNMHVSSFFLLKSKTLTPLLRIK
jgi:hypothetical protein